MLNDIFPPTLKQGAWVIAPASLAALCSAWFTQYVLGFEPCQLCMAQRWPYYLGIGLGIAAIIGVQRGADGAARALIALTGLVMVAGAGIAAYHSGVEWKFWPGPSGCSGGTALSTNVADLLAQAKQARIVPCDKPPFRVLGFSPANANVLISIAFALICFWTAARGAGTRAAKA